MELFRFSKPKYAGKKTASGGRARWNYDSEYVIYCSHTRSLASLQILVRANYLDLQPDSFQITIFRLPDEVGIKVVNLKDLPDNYGYKCPYSETQPIGSEWYEKNESLLLRIPSAIINKEYNYLINTNSDEFNKVEIIEVEDFLFDLRFIDQLKEKDK